MEINCRILLWTLLQLCLIGIILSIQTNTPIKPFRKRSPLSYTVEVFDAKQCGNASTNLRQFVTSDKLPIRLQVTNNVLHQITTRIYALLIRDYLGYQDRIEILAIKQNQDEIDFLLKLRSELEKKIPTINTGFWVPNGFQLKSNNIGMAGAITLLLPGRYSWFIPNILLGQNDLPELLPYTMFMNYTKNNFYIQQFVMDDLVIDFLQPFIDPDVLKLKSPDFYNGTFIPSQCINVECATIIAPDYNSTNFITVDIIEFNLRVKVIWLEKYLKLIIDELMNYYRHLPRRNGVKQKFMFLYYTPSELQDVTVDLTKFSMITMPKQEKYNFRDHSKYEVAPILKYYSQAFNELSGQSARYALEQLSYSNNGLTTMMTIYNREVAKVIGNHSLNYSDMDKVQIQKHFNQLKVSIDTLRNHKEKDIYNNVACEWLLSDDGKSIIAALKKQSKPTIGIGAIYPMNGVLYEGLYIAFQLASKAIKESGILNEINLEVKQANGVCKNDVVLKSLINYLRSKDHPVLGILGPACTETLEPIAGVSKYYHMPVISYSAEGTTFTDRVEYPFFFRTIGENRQYIHAFLHIFQKYNWRRIAALTEDGLKYTEYISIMEDVVLKPNNITIIANKKFSKNPTQAIIKQNLKSLQDIQARIIIADVFGYVAEMVMCEAYKMRMTGEHGYVWFLPSWLSANWTPNQFLNSTTQCTESELKNAFMGHFSIHHNPYGSDESIVPEQNKTVKQWKEDYKKACEMKNVKASPYASYAYDAIWTYAVVLKKLFQDDTSHINDLHSNRTALKLKEFLWETDFTGVSGHVHFTKGGSRISDIEILQWIDGNTITVGNFKPNITEVIRQNYSISPEMIDGVLQMNESKILWLTDKVPPTDGTETCTIESFATYFGLTCSKATYALTMTFVLFIFLIVSFAMYSYWKRIYTKKFERSARIMRNLGIDITAATSSLNNSLDKWEIPKERVVINRRLGEGAFGAVYGGEAQIHPDGWTAVAVKTLKEGATTEDRIDFLAEAETMKRFDHKNIVQLLGVCLQTEPIFTIMEFMLYGDLKVYLLSRRNLVNEKISDDSDISPKRLTMMALDVVRALSYLAEMKYVHRDVACRNCLVNAQRVVKLGDFGMARSTFDNDYYKFNRKGMLPVRWMAPESLVLGYFTPASDIWSFGVLLYEIVTFGSFPFQGMSNSQVLEHLKNGNTLNIPAGVKPHLEGLMKACWNPDSKKRPSASEITEFISNYPRLITPCLDLPNASVQMPETDSDEFEILPGFKKHPTILNESQTLNNLDTKSPTTNINNNKLNVTIDDDGVDENGYSPMCNGAGGLYSPATPLLQPNSEISKSNLSLRRYVPMYALRRATPNNDGTDVATSAL